MASRPPLLEGLNPQQREAVLATDGPVLILAGAGSGKTRVITHRIAHLVLDKGLASDRILAVTFTNKAAGEMRGRVEELLGGRVSSWISTFHSLCVRILRREHEAAGLSRDFLIYDEDDQLAAVRAALAALDLSEKLNPPRRLLARISARKNSGLDPGAAGDGSFAAETFARIAGRYREILDQARALDFDDLLLKTVALLGEQEELRERYRQRFLYLLVDEYQDTNRVQYDLMRHLAGAAGNVTVVGDEDQSIYSWRGADIRNILDFEQDFPGARVLRLEANYRSSQAILDTATGLVAHNTRRKGKQLRAVRAEGEAVRLYRAGDDFQEAAWVAERLAALGGRGRAAVLYRINAQSRLLEEALMRAGLPYAVVGGVGFYARREVKDVLAYARLALNPRDRVALHRVVNVPARGIGERAEEEIDRLAAQRGSTPWEALGVAVDEALVPARTALALARFRDLIEALRREAGQLTVKGFLEYVLALSGYSAMLAQDDSQESQDRLENLAELLSAAAEYQDREEEPTLAGFLDRVSLLSDVDQTRGEAPVVLMTLHSAKGLEFESVFLVGLEEGLIPHARSLESEEALEEERRLCYVGMTRAMQRLHLSWAESRLVFGQRRLSEPSRFLAEIPRRSIELSGESALALPRTRATPPALADADGSPSAVSAERPAVPRDLRPGMRVRHPLFGFGTVLRSDGSGEDLKLTVSFAGIGAKRLVARYAGLVPVDQAGRG
jgi:DNA helicase-2/ATP-dependent DNA helicase PcrA